jgi:hypothetical protein
MLHRYYNRKQQLTNLLFTFCINLFGFMVFNRETEKTVLYKLSMGRVCYGFFQKHEKAGKEVSK